MVFILFKHCMIEKIRKKSFLLSSNWYKKYKLPYFILVFDVLLILLTAIFSVKDYLVGCFDTNYPYNGILIILIISILLIIRFNISLLMFSKQRFGIYLSILFLLSAILIELVFEDLGSPIILVFESIIAFFNDFIIKLPSFIYKGLVYLLYLITIYGPLIYYAILRIRKIELSSSAKTFDIMTGFYASTLSKRLKIIDIVTFSFLFGIAMSIGLISKDIRWTFLSVLLTLYSLYEFLKRMHFPRLNSKKKIIIYISALLISFLVIYFQRLPYIGLIFFMFSVVFMFLLISLLSKSYLRSIIVVVFSFIVVPIFCMGYNIFAFPQYGVIKKSVPYENEKIFYKIVNKEGLYGVRNRNFKMIEPVYKEVIHYEKNKIKLQNQNLEWKIYNITNNERRQPAKRISIFNIIKKKKN